MRERGKRGFVATLGAGELIDYRATDFAARLDGVDVVLDTIGGGMALHRIFATSGTRCLRAGRSYYFQ